MNRLKEHRILSLEVTRFAGAPPPQPMQVSFDEQGGSIGRREDNDWVLPDPQRFISGLHALISFSEGRFFVTDVSSNGVFLNRAETPLGNQARAPLAAGDTLLIGEYEIRVSLQEPAPLAADAGSFDALDDPYARLLNENAGIQLEEGFTPSFDGPKVEEPEPAFSLDESRPAELDIEAPVPLEPPLPGVASESDHVSDLNSHYSQPKPLPENPLIPEDWQIENDTPEAGATALPASPSTSPTPARFPADRAVAESGRHSREGRPDPATVAPRSGGETPSAPSPAAPDREASVTALARGLGISRNTLDEIPLPELLENLGRVLRSSVEGVMSILRARAQMKSEFRMSQTMIRPVENNPLKFSVNTEEALRHIINPRPGSGYLSPLAAFREAHEDTEAHMLAVMVGMQSALKAVLQRFKPESLEQRLGQKALLEKVPLYRRAKSWELFTKLYGEIANEAEDDFHQLFGRTFSQAYEAQIRRLASLKHANGDITTHNRN